MCEHLEQIFEEDWGEAIQRQVGVGSGVVGFLEQVEEKLDACVHYGNVVRCAPLHQLAEWLDPGLQRVLFEDLADEQGKGSH